MTYDKKGDLFYECKYASKPIGRSVLDEEETQIKELSLKPYRLGFITKSGFTDDFPKDETTRYTLQDFYDRNLSDD